MRPSDWQIGVTLQQEILPRVSIEVGYTRRGCRTSPSPTTGHSPLRDFDTFSVVAPLDSRLPGGGGYTVTGLYQRQA